MQGLLLLDTDDLPKNMYFAEGVLRKFKNLAEKLDVSPRELALAYVRTKMPQTKVIIGVETPRQLEDNCRTWKMKISSSAVHLVEDEIKIIDKKIINPTLWKK